jgi:hypothetical protein
MCRCRTSLIRGTKKGHGKISWPNPIGKHIQVLQQNPAKSCRDSDRLACPLRADSVAKVVLHWWLEILRAADVLFV